ncbi:MAG: sugar nucleotide-binding protein [Candidatus Delongbacteria bacterium]
MRLYITGCSGFVGSRLAEAWAGVHELAGCSRHPLPGQALEYHPLDLAEEPRALADRLEAFRPDWVIHCAAVSQPLLFARDPLRCRRVNVEAGHWLARWCRRRDRGLIAFSSDTVYADAAKGATHAAPAAQAAQAVPAGGWREDSPLAPVHQYGRSKQELEEAVLAELPTALLLRSSLLWGRARVGQNSFSGWLLKRLEESDTEAVPVFRDNRRNLLAAGALPEILERMLELMMAGGAAADGLRGPLNLGSADYLSREDFARRLFRQLGLDESRLRPLDTAEAGLSEPLARELPLDLTRLRELLGALPSTDDWLPREYPR